MRRTVRLLLNPSPEQEILLRETSQQFTEVFNFACVTGWEAEERNAVRLHHLCYYPAKEQFPELVSDYCVQAIRKASEALTAVFTLRKKGRKVSCPRSELCPPRCNGGTFKVSWENNSVRLSTTQGRITLRFDFPKFAQVYLEIGKICTGDLLYQDGRWYLNVVLELPAPEITPTEEVVGVDLGINRPAVTSKAEFLGEKRWKEIENRTFRQRRACQQKGTRSAKRKLKKLGRKQYRFRRDCDHVLSKEIVAGVDEGGTIVLENLTDIRKRMKGRKRQRRRMHSWPFAQLKTFVRYKAEAKGIRVELIDPRHTSQTCSKCGYQHRSNRKSQSLFHCRSCGFCLNADLNAARNIRAKKLGSFGISSTTRAPSTAPTGSRPQSSNRRSSALKPRVG